MQICGYKKVDFTTEDKMEISGYNIYLFGEFNKQKNFVERGCFFEKVFLSTKKFEDLNVHDIYEEQREIMPLYNKYGKIERFI